MAQHARPCHRTNRTRSHLLSKGACFEQCELRIWRLANLPVFFYANGTIVVIKRSWLGISVPITLRMSIHVHVDVFMVDILILVVL